MLPSVLQAYNMAAIWEIPVVFVIENNHYGMGTSDSRASKSAKYYTRGDYIPGIWVDGMDVLSVKSATAFAKQYVLEHGPLMLEMVRILLRQLRGQGLFASGGANLSAISPTVRRGGISTAFCSAYNVAACNSL